MQKKTASQLPKILLVEDDENLGFTILDHLKEAGYGVELCKDGKEGLLAFHKNSYDLCLLDIMLPEKDGFSLAADIKHINEGVPLIFLTAKSLTEDKIRGLKIGADDYITKPFSSEELLLRIEAVLKRSSDQQDKTKGKDTFFLGAYTFLYNDYLLQHPEQERKLTKKEAEILRLLCLHKNKVLQRELVLDMVWGESNYFLGRSLDVFISKLRKYLSKDEAVKITNTHGVGFKLEAPEAN